MVLMPLQGNHRPRLWWVFLSLVTVCLFKTGEDCIVVIEKPRFKGEVLCLFLPQTFCLFLLLVLTKFFESI